MVDMVSYTDEIANVIHDFYKYPGKPLLFLLHGLNTDSNSYSKPATIQVICCFNSFLPIFTNFHF